MKVCRDGTRGSAFRQRVGLDWIKGEIFLQWGWWDTPTGVTEKLWVPHHWQCSLSAWPVLSNLIHCKMYLARKLDSMIFNHRPIDDSVTNRMQSGSHFGADIFTIRHFIHHCNYTLLAAEMIGWDWFPSFVSFSLSFLHSLIFFFTIFPPSENSH